jgi:hypothetical protein
MADGRNKKSNNFVAGLAKSSLNRAVANRGWDGEFLFIMALAAVLVITLWWTPLLLPFRIYTTAAHEGGHALSAILMGGGVSRVELNWNGSGLAMISFRPNFISQVVIYSAGYLGSVLFGGILLLVIKRADWRRVTLGVIAGLLALMAVLWMRDFESLALAGLGIVLAGGLAWKGPDLAVTFSLFMMALLSSLYSIMDLFFLFMSTSNPFGHGGNDAVFLANATGIPAFVWAISWALLGVLMMVLFVRRAVVRKIPKATAYDPYSSPYAPSKGDNVSPFDRYDDYLGKK